MLTLSNNQTWNILPFPEKVSLFINRIFFTLLISLVFPTHITAQFANEIINYTSWIKVEKRKLITEQSCIIQVNDKYSDWISEIQIPYKKDQKLEILEACIINSAGVQVRTLKGNEIITRSRFSNQSLYEDILVREFSLKWNEYPYLIKYSYRKTEKDFLYITDWSPFFRNSPVRDASLKVELPLEFKVNTLISGNFDYDTDTLEKNIVHTWKISNLPSVKVELCMPPLQELLHNVTIVPLNFTYGLQGSFASWSSFGSWIESLNHGMDIIPKDEEEKVNALIKDISDRREIITRLYHYLQDNTRYINVSIDIGGLKPYPASYVAHNKYGDCKALTIYMKALLKHVQIPSYYTIIHAGENHPDINLNYPSQPFNHVILSVPINEDTIWLDNTANYLPVNYPGTFNQNRYALLVNADQSKIVRTPALSMDDVLESRVYNFQFDEKGDGSLLLTKMLRGKKFENYRYIQHNFTEKNQKTEIEEETDFNNSVLKKWYFDYPDRDEHKLELRLEMDVKNQVRNLGGMIVLVPVSLKTYDFEKPELRENPVWIHYPVNWTDTIIYDLPFFQNYTCEIPENIDLETDYGKYSEQFLLEKGKIRILRNF